MADNTQIEWTEATWNPVTGCSVLSPGCTNCYAMKLAGTRLAHHPSRAGLTIDTKAGPVWNGEVRFNEQWLDQPLRWKRPRMIFVCAHGDLFHEAVPDEWIDRVLAVMALAPQHTFQVLTKRSARMREYVSGLDADWHTNADAFNERMLAAMDANMAWLDEEQGIDEVNWPLPNVWLGVSVEDQQRADDRIPDLLATPAAVRWLSCEPLLGAVDLRWIAQPDEDADGVIDALLGCNWIQTFGDDFEPVRPGHEGRKMGRWVVSGDEHILANRKLDWIVAGGESGPGARPMHPDWARSLRDQCAAAGVPFFFKQWGEYVEVDGARCRGGPVPRTERRGTFWLKNDGRRLDRGDRMAASCSVYGTDCIMKRVGKRQAGRLLDGVEHNDFPTAKGA